MLHINDLTYRLGARVLFDSAGAALPDNARIGFVGRNGTGKTTLFRMISGELSPESGSVTYPKQARLGRVEQEAPGGPGTLIDFVLEADKERHALLLEAETATDPNRIADIPPPHARRPFWPVWALTMMRSTALCRNFPAAGGCVWRWRRCSSPSRIFCSSTSRPTISIWKARSG